MAHADALGTLGRLSLRRGPPGAEAARDWFAQGVSAAEAALALNPDHPDYRRRLADLRADLKKLGGP